MYAERTFNFHTPGVAYGKRIMLAKRCKRPLAHDKAGSNPAARRGDLNMGIDR